MSEYIHSGTCTCGRYYENGYGEGVELDIEKKIHCTDCDKKFKPDKITKREIKDGEKVDTEVSLDET